MSSAVQLRIERGESGAILVLALLFMVATGLVLTALVSLSGTNLTTTVDLQDQRNLEFSADGAIDGAIQAVRHQSTSLTSPSCPSYPSTGSFSTNGTTLVVQCEISIPADFYGRLAEFDACSPGLTFAMCQAQAVVRAEVLFNDVQPTSINPGCTSGAVAGCYPDWGAGGMTLESWVVESANA